jgi:hypothetical protein
MSNIIKTRAIIERKAKAFISPFQTSDCHIANHSPPIETKPTE